MVFDSIIYIWTGNAIIIPGMILFQIHRLRFQPKINYFSLIQGDPYYKNAKKVMYAIIRPKLFGWSNMKLIFRVGRSDWLPFYFFSFKLFWAKNTQFVYFLALSFYFYTKAPIFLFWALFLITPINLFRPQLRPPWTRIC